MSKKLDKSLHDACAKGKLRKVREILQNNTDITSKLAERIGFSGYTPLHEAACQGHADILQLLLIYGGNVDVKANGNYTPLHIAASMNFVKCIEVLLRHGANIRALDDYDKTPYQTAMQHSRKESAKCLKSAEIVKAAGNDSQQLQCLLEETLMNEITPTCFDNALIQACHYGNFEAACMLLTAGAKNIMESCRISIRKGHYKIVALLLICYAALKRDLVMLQALLDRNLESEKWFEQFVQGNVPMLTVIESVRENLKNLKEFTSVAIKLSDLENAFSILKVLLLNTSCSRKEKKVKWNKLALTSFDKSWLDAIKDWVQNLNLSHNKITAMPEGMSDLKFVATLNLSKNKLKIAPCELFSMICLRDLNLASNLIAELPDIIQWRPTLKSLNISNNNLKLLPDGIAKSCLQTLNLSRNKFIRVPEVLCEIITLKSLDLSDNLDIGYLPEKMGKLCNLTYVGLRNLDQITDPPQPMRQNAEDLVMTLRQRLRKCEPYYTMKLMLVGKGCQGKTTLVHRLRDDFEFKENDLTQGVDISDLIIKRGSLYQAYTFKVWDFGGQEDYYATHQCFLSSMSLYLLVWRLDDGEIGVAGLTPWLDNIAARAPESTVIIVGTHLDRITTEEHGEEYVSRMKRLVFDLTRKPRYIGKIKVPENGICAVSCVFGGSRPEICSLRLLVYDTASNMKKGRAQVMGERIPISFISLIHRIERLKIEKAKKDELPIIRKEEFHALVLENSQQNKGDIYELRDVRDATVFLRERGVILHFDDPNEGLSDLYFVDPRWLCSLMARVITIRGNADLVVNGILEIEKTKTLFKGRLPFHFHGQYIRLLIRFQIVYLLDATRILVPSKLPESQPEEVTNLKLTYAPVRRIYRIDYTKIHGFWSRFMSRFLFYMKEMIAIDGHEDNCFAHFCRSCLGVDPACSRTFTPFLSDDKWMNKKKSEGSEEVSSKTTDSENEVNVDGRSQKESLNKGSFNEEPLKKHLPKNSKRSFLKKSQKKSAGKNNRLKDAVVRETSRPMIISSPMKDQVTTAGQSNYQALLLDPCVKVFSEDELCSETDGFLFNDVNTAIDKSHRSVCGKRTNEVKRSEKTLRIPSFDESVQGNSTVETQATDDETRGEKKIEWENEATRCLDEIASGLCMSSETSEISTTYSDDIPTINGENNVKTVDESVKDKMTSKATAEKKEILKDTNVFSNDVVVDNDKITEEDDDEKINSEKKEVTVIDLIESVEYGRSLVSSNCSLSSRHDSKGLSSNDTSYIETHGTLTMDDTVVYNDNNRDNKSNDTVDRNQGFHVIINSHPVSPDCDDAEIKSRSTTPSVRSDEPTDLDSDSFSISSVSTSNSNERRETLNLTGVEVLMEPNQSTCENSCLNVCNNTMSDNERDLKANDRLENDAVIENEEKPLEIVIPSTPSQGVEFDNCDGASLSVSSRSQIDRAERNKTKKDQIPKEDRVHCQNSCGNAGKDKDDESSSKNYKEREMKKCTLCKENVPVDELVTISLDVANLIERKYLHCWGSGVCLIDPCCVFLYVVYRQLSDSVVVEIAVSPNSVGRRLLTFVVDHLDTLINEWYPGLLMSLGVQPTVQKLIPCRSCEKDGRFKPHIFTFDASVTQYSMGNFLKCPEHEVSFQDIVPDIVFHDIDSNLLLQENELNYERSEENFIGGGGFGKVYSGKCRGKEAAIKEYCAPFGEDNAVKKYCDIRNEVNILRRVGQHPYLVNLIGICLRPLRLVLELAKHGSLATTLLDPQFLFERVVMHRMLRQLANALSFLHSLKVTYRDLKPDNVLVISYSELDDVNIKLTDFGTAAFRFNEGLMDATGTAGFQAPEMLKEFSKRDGFNEKVDIFSFGMLVFEFITRRQPYFNALSEAEISNMVVDGMLPSWDHVLQARMGLAGLTSLMKICLSYEPDSRPSASIVEEQMLSTSFQLFLGLIALPEKQSVRHVGLVKSVKDKIMELWVVVDDKVKTMVFIYNLHSFTLKKKFTINQLSGDDPVLCLQVNCMHVTLNNVLIGLRGDRNAVAIYDTATYRLKAAIRLEEPVFSLSSTDSHIYMGMASGLCLVTTLTKILHSIEVTRLEPVTCVTVVKKKELWLTAGKCIQIFHSNGDAKIPVFDLNSVRFSSSSAPFSQLRLFDEAIWSISKGDSIVTAWDINNRQKYLEIDCKSFFPSSDYDALESIVTCVLAVHDTLWIGTGRGKLLICDVMSGELITCWDLFDDYVRTLTLVPGPGPCATEKYYVIVSGRKVKDRALSRKSTGNCVCLLDKEFIKPAPLEETSPIRRPEQRGRFLRKTSPQSLSPPTRVSPVDYLHGSVLMFFEALPADVLKRSETQ